MATTIVIQWWIVTVIMTVIVWLLTLFLPRGRDEFGLGLFLRVIGATIITLGFWLIYVLARLIWNIV